jgi:NAD(P)-dependent dehydrogenase (short-subunit alcohol dehydrogenase family)
MDASANKLPFWRAPLTGIPSGAALGMTTQDLSQRVALVSGSGRGIGRAIALVMAERGADIVLLDVESGAVAAVAAEIEALGRRVHRGVCDVTNINATAALVCAAEAGLGHIDILVNNAGIPGGEIGFQEIDESTYDRMLDIHVKGAFFLTQAVIASMKRQRSGRIVNISSNRGMIGHSLSPHYSAAKAALLGLTKAWARELAPYGILVNAVAPGVVRTDMTTRHGLAPLREEADLNLLKRWAEPTEIAYSVAFLASVEASYMTGQVLCPNGGYPIVGI